MSLIADANDRFPSTTLAGNYTRGAEEVRTSGNQDPHHEGRSVISEVSAAVCGDFLHI
jgi:hypothetical protein